MPSSVPQYPILNCKAYLALSQAPPIFQSFAEPLYHTASDEEWGAGPGNEGIICDSCTALIVHLSTHQLIYPWMYEWDGGVYLCDEAMAYRILEAVLAQSRLVSPQA